MCRFENLLSWIFNVVQGRNLAIATESVKIIVSTDIRCPSDKEGLVELVHPMFNDPNLEW